MRPFAYLMSEYITDKMYLTIKESSKFDATFVITKTDSTRHKERLSGPIKGSDMLIKSTVRMI